MRHVQQAARAGSGEADLILGADADGAAHRTDRKAIAVGIREHAGGIRERSRQRADVVAGMIDGHIPSAAQQCQSAAGNRRSRGSDPAAGKRQVAGTGAQRLRDGQVADGGIQGNCAIGGAGIDAAGGAGRAHRVTPPPDITETPATGRAGHNKRRVVGGIQRNGARAAGVGFQSPDVDAGVDTLGDIATAGERENAIPYINIAIGRDIAPRCYGGIALDDHGLDDDVVDVVIADGLANASGIQADMGPVVGAGDGNAVIAIYLQQGNARADKRAAAGGADSATGVQGQWRAGGRTEHAAQGQGSRSRAVDGVTADFDDACAGQL